MPVQERDVRLLPMPPRKSSLSIDSRCFSNKNVNFIAFRVLYPSHSIGPKLALLPRKAAVVWIGKGKDRSQVYLGWVYLRGNGDPFAFPLFSIYRKHSRRNSNSTLCRMFAMPFLFSLSAAKEARTSEGK